MGDFSLLWKKVKKRQNYVHVSMSSAVHNDKTLQQSDQILQQMVVLIFYALTTSTIVSYSFKQQIKKFHVEEEHQVQIISFHRPQKLDPGKYLKLCLFILRIHTVEAPCCGLILVKLWVNRHRSTR